MRNPYEMGPDDIGMFSSGFDAQVAMLEGLHDALLTILAEGLKPELVPGVEFSAKIIAYSTKKLKVEAARVTDG